MAASDLRWRLVLLLVAAAVGGALIMLATAYQAEFRAWLEEDLRTRARIVVAALAVATAGPTLGFSAYLWIAGGKPVLRICAAVLAVAVLLLVYFMFRVVP